MGTIFKKNKAKKATILDTGFKVRDTEDGKMKKVSGLRREGPKMHMIHVFDLQSDPSEELS